VLRIGGVATALAAVVFAAVPMLSQNRLEASQAAATRGDLGAAIEAADDARAVEPWASTPYLQLALLEEQRGNLGQANRYVGRALKRDRSDWSTWLVAARVQTKAGFIEKGRRSLRQAERLNRKSKLFEALRDRAPKSSRNSG
jgi:Tfp pilus assembly protein PilF